MTPQEIEALRSERDALAAWVNDACALLTRIAQSEEAVINNDVKKIIDSELMYDISDFVEYKTPQQCLRDIQAEAGRAGWNACVDWLVENISNLGWYSTYFTVSEFADKVRQGGAE